MSETMDEEIISRLTRELALEREGVLAQNEVVLSLTKKVREVRFQLSLSQEEVARLKEAEKEIRMIYEESESAEIEILKKRIAELEAENSRLIAEAVRLRDEALEEAAIDCDEWRAAAVLHRPKNWKVLQFAYRNAMHSIRNKKSPTPQKKETM